MIGRSIAFALLAVGAVVMGTAITYGFVAGSFREEGRILLEIPWGQVSLIDVYVGFALIGGWVVFRERSAPRSAAWIVAFCLLGNFATCVYALLALRASGGDWNRFWLGRRSLTPRG